MFIFQGEIEMQKKTEYPETALQRVVSLWRCVQFCVPGIMLEGSYNNLQQHDWSWCDDDGDDDDDDDDDDDLWFMAINIDISKLMLYDFLCPSFAELPPQTPAHPPKTFHVHLTFVCRLCFFGKSPRALDAWAHPNAKNRGKSITQCLGNKLDWCWQGHGWHGFQILWQGEVSTTLKLS